MENNFAPHNYASHVGIELKKRNFVNEAWLSSAVLMLENSSTDSVAMQRGAELLNRENSVHEACLQTILDPAHPITLEQTTQSILDSNAKQWLIGTLRTGENTNFDFDPPEIPEKPKISKYDNMRVECFLCMRDRLKHYSEYEDKIAVANNEAINTYDNMAAAQFKKEAENWLSIYRKVGQTPMSIETDYLLFQLFANDDRSIIDILYGIQRTIAKGEWRSGSNSGLPLNLCANLIDDLILGVGIYIGLRRDLIASGVLTGKEPKYTPDGRQVKDVLAEEANNTFWGKLSHAKDEFAAGNENNLRGKIGTLVGDFKNFMKKPPTGTV